MQTRTLGSTDLEFSVVGLGTWAIGGGDWAFGWGDQDNDEAVASIHRAIELGVNWIDTAPVYGFGNSESLVGKALSTLGAAERPLIASKCGRLNQGDGTIAKCLKRESVLAECEASLKRLKVDCIDLYQLHWPEPDEEIEEGWRALIDLQTQGKVREIGVSNHQVSHLDRLQAIQTPASLQPPYSMISRDIESELLPYCGQHDIGVICYSPMGKGLLTGAFTAQRAQTLSEKDHRSRDPRFQSPQLEINLAFVEGLQKVAGGLGWTIPELAISWVLRRPEVTAAIVGSRRPEQIEQSVMAGSRTLDQNACQQIESLLKRRDDDLNSLGEIQQARV